jgi:solute carrier family 25 S-adenosylmethionine transporter 26
MFRCCLVLLLAVTCLLSDLSFVSGFGLQHPKSRTYHDHHVADHRSRCTNATPTEIAKRHSITLEGDASVITLPHAWVAISSATIFLIIIGIPTDAVAADTAAATAKAQNFFETATTALPPPSSTISLTSSSLQESISGFIAGAALSTTKTLVKFPLDTATVRLQQWQQQRQRSSGNTVHNHSLSSLFQDCYNGVTVTLIFNIPAGAVFFAVKDAVKSGLITSALLTLPKWAITCIAVGIAQLPYWLVRNPSEVIKVRQQTMEGGSLSASQVMQQSLQLDGNTDGSSSAGPFPTSAVLQDLYTGYVENILYAYPADVLKFVLYEVILTQGRSDLSPLEGAEAGAVATAIAQLWTTPLDVIRNRLMMRSPSMDGYSSSDSGSPTTYWGRLVKLANDEGWEGLFAGAAPRVGKAILSGAIQFATYEETKQSILKLLMGTAVTGGGNYGG